MTSHSQHLQLEEKYSLKSTPEHVTSKFITNYLYLNQLYSLTLKENFKVMFLNQNNFFNGFFT